MTIEGVREFVAQHASNVTAVDLERPSKTRWLSAALRIKAAQIAKPPVLRVSDRHILLIACGDARVNNYKAKALFNGKLRFVAAEEAAILTGHVPGGMCPLACVRWIGVAIAHLLRRPANGASMLLWRCDAQRGQDQSASDGGDHRRRMGRRV